MKTFKRAALAQGGLTVAKRTVSQPVRLHLHEYYELEIILEGTGTQDLNGTIYPLGPGTVYFLTPIDFHSVEPRGDLRLANLSFDESMLTPQLRLLFTNRRQNFIFESDPDLRTLMELLLEEAARADGYSPACQRGLLELILYHIARGVERSAFPQPATGQLRSAMQYLFCHFREDITLPALARQCGYTPTYFSRVFHQCCGESFVDFLGALRLNYAKTLLLSTGLSVTEVAEKSGFGSPSSFHRLFKQRLGLSPAAWRKAAQNT